MRKKNNYLPRFPLHVGSYTIESAEQATVEVEMFKVYQFTKLPFYKHD